MTEIRRSRDDDEEGIRELFQTCFGRELKHEEWLWKYRESPWGSVSYIALDAGRVVAHYGGIRYRFQGGGELLWAYQFCDVMTHPDYRGKVFSERPPIVRAGELLYEESVMDFAFGFPSERHARLQSLRLGGSRHERVAEFHKNVHESKGTGGRHSRLQIGWDAVKVDDMENVWERCSPGYTLSIVKDSAYLLWRFRRHPLRDYEAIILRGFLRGKVKGLAVVGFEKDTMNILDFFVPEEGAYGEFWNALESVALKKRVREMVVWGNASEEDICESLAESGFRQQEGIPCAVRIMNEGEIIADFYRHYCYRMGDYDDR
jgi:hypothetical protein